MERRSRGELRHPGEGVFASDVLDPTVDRVEPGYVLLDTYDVLRQHVVSHHFRFEDGSQVELGRSRHRYVWPSELDLMALTAGFEQETRHADWQGAPFTADSFAHVSVYRLP